MDAAARAGHGIAGDFEIKIVAVFYVVCAGFFPADDVFISKKRRASTDDAKNREFADGGVRSGWFSDNVGSADVVAAKEVVG